MAKLKSFEQFVAEMDRAEEIEKDVVDTAEVVSKTPEEVEDEAKEVQEEEGSEEESAEATEESEESDEEAEETDESKFNLAKKLAPGLTGAMADATGMPRGTGLDASVIDDEDGDGVEDEDDEEVLDEENNPTEESIDVIDVAKGVADMMKEAYEACKEEAKAYEEDAHDEHTIESYMKENAALVAALAAGALKEMKEDYAVEAFEAACNEMVEAYTKKMNEMKEMDSAADAEDAAE